MTRSLVLAALSGATLLAGCTVGPNYHAPEMAVPAAYAEPQPAAPGTTIDPATWWTAFGDATLTSLVERALKDNPDIAIAGSRVRQARLQEIAAHAVGKPTVDAMGNVTPPAAAAAPAPEAKTMTVATTQSAPTPAAAASASDDPVVEDSPSTQSTQSTESTQASSTTNAAKPTTTRPTGVVTAAGPSASPKPPNPVGSVVGGVTSTVGGVTGGVTNVVGGVTGGVTNVVGGVTGGVTNTVGGLTGGLTGALGGLGKTP